MWAIDIEQIQTPHSCDAILIMHFALAGWEETSPSNTLKEKKLRVSPRD